MPLSQKPVLASVIGEVEHAAKNKDKLAMSNVSLVRFLFFNENPTFYSISNSFGNNLDNFKTWTKLFLMS